MAAAWGPRTTGHGWSRGYEICRHGQVTELAPALERLAMREVSGRFLAQDERIETAGLRQARPSIRQVAGRLARRGRPPAGSCAATRPGG
jgi:transposase, IS30 family